MYKSVAIWRDLEDGHLYQIGDLFPHDGRKVPPERIAELSGAQNKAGFTLICPCATPNRETSAEEAEPPKKPIRGRKKTT